MAVYQQRPEDRAVVHLHATHSVAVSCPADVNPQNVLPPITAYYVMKIGRLPLIPYFPPGDMALADEVGKTAKDAHAMLLANHGPVISGKRLDATVYAAEELEETARLYLLLRDKPTRFLDESQCDQLRQQFPS